MFQSFYFYYTHTRAKKREKWYFLWHIRHSNAQIRYHKGFPECAKDFAFGTRKFYQTM